MTYPGFRKPAGGHLVFNKNKKKCLFILFRWCSETWKSLCMASGGIRKPPGCNKTSRRSDEAHQCGFETCTETIGSEPMDNEDPPVKISKVHFTQMTILNFAYLVISSKRDSELLLFLYPCLSLKISM